MKKKLIKTILIILFLPFFPCFAQNNKASIYIKRPPMVGALWVHYMELNGVYLGQVKGGECIKIEVDPGTYVLNYYNGSMRTYEEAKQAGASFTKAFELSAGESKFLKIDIKVVEIACLDDDGRKGFKKINNTINFSALQKMSKNNQNLATINNSQNSSQQLSADQLAEAIAKAMDKTNESSKESDDVTPNKANQRKTPQSDVDINIPISKRSKSSANNFVLIIANESYRYVDPVNFALNDGEIFKEYCIKTLGIPEKNITYYANATVGDIYEGVDGLANILNVVEDGRGIVYYCGHGIPNENTGDAYILPVDGKATNTKTCYSLQELYTKLGSTKAKDITYLLDACFTGADKSGSMLVAARGVAREAKKATVPPNTFILSAAKGDQTAMTYPEKEHGLFTYFLLKKLQETGGDVSYNDLRKYVADNVAKESLLINKKQQTPVANAGTALRENDYWRTMTLK